MRLSTKLLTASASALILGGASAQAQTVLINQNGGGMSLGNSNEAILKNNGTGAVNLQAFQDVANTVNKGTAIYNLNLPVGTVTQNLGASAAGGGVNFNSSNLNGTFSALGPQTTSGSQGINTVVNNATLGLANNAAVSILQSSIGQSGSQDGITANQSNVMSAGYQNSPANGVPFPTPGGQYIGQGPAFIQGQSIDANGNIVNNGFQNNSFALNTANIVAGGAASVALGQKPGDINAVLTNFADAGVATPGATPVDPSIKNMNQLVNGKVNQLNSSGPANSTLTLDGTGQTGFQVVGTPVTPVGATTATPVSQDFVVQNAARALTWANQPTVTPTLNTPATWTPSQGGAGNVQIQDTTQTVDLGFNGIVAGTTAAPVNVDFGGRSGGQFDQIAQYGTYTPNQTAGITISNVAQPGAFPSPTPAPVNNNGYPLTNNDSVVSPQYATTPIQGMMPIATKLSSIFPAPVNQPYASFVDGAVNTSIAGTGDGAATLTNVNQSGLARFNTASVTGTVTGNFGQEANINTDGVTAITPATTPTTYVPTGNGPAISNFATAAVTNNGPATMNNVDQTTGTLANALYSSGVTADGLRLTQAGYKTASYTPASPGTPGVPNNPEAISYPGYYPEASTNVVLATAGPLSVAAGGPQTVGGPIMSPASTSGNATIRPTSTSTAVVDGSTQVASDLFNVFSTGASAGTIELNQTLTPTPVGVTVNTTPNPDVYASAPSGFGGVNAAGAIAPGSNATLKNGAQLGLVAVNAASIGAASGNTEIFQNASTTGVDTLGNSYTGSTLVSGQNYAVAAGQTGNITNYRQSYASSINSVDVAGTGARYVEQNSGNSTIDLSNNMGAASLNGTATGTTSIAGATQILSSDVNKASLNNIGTLNQTSGTTNSTLANRATTTTATQSGTSITGLVQSSSQSVNTNTGM